MFLIKKNMHYKEFVRLQRHIFEYAAPVNLNYFWSFGFLSGLALIIQIISGVILTTRYIPSVELAFISIEHICVMSTMVGYLLIYTQQARLFSLLLCMSIF